MRVLHWVPAIAVASMTAVLPLMFHGYPAGVPHEG